MYLIFGLSVHATSELNEKDLQEFKTAIQNPPKSLLSLAEAESKQTELERAAEKAKTERIEQLFPQLILHIEAIVQTPEHAELFSVWMTSLNTNQYVLALEAFAEKYSHSGLHQQILNAIFQEAHDDGEDFFEWNYMFSPANSWIGERENKVGSLSYSSISLSYGVIKSRDLSFF